MDYKIMWERLRQDMIYFQAHLANDLCRIAGIDLCIACMNFIEGIEKAKESESPVGYVEK